MRTERVILVGIDGLQLSQIQYFIDQEALPNVNRLLAMGSAGELLPDLPAWTPTNWGAIATGSFPGSSMLAGWHRHNNDDLEGKWDLSTFSSRACPVETIWEAAEKAGLVTLSINYPLTWPPRVKKGMIVAPLYSGPGIIPLGISKWHIWTTKHGKLRKIGKMDDTSLIEVVPDDDVFLTDVEIIPSAMELAKEFNFGDRPKESREKVERGKSVPIKIAFDQRKKKADLFFPKENKKCTIYLGKWSDWLILDFGARGEGTARFYLYSCEENSEFGFTLAHSSVYPTKGFAFPAELADELTQNVGPYLPSPIRLPGVRGAMLWLEDYEYQGLWMAKAARHILETRGWDLYYQHFHIIDSVSHKWLNGADPEGGGYESSKADFNRNMIRKAYEITDKVLGLFMEMMNDRTVLSVVSDHGNAPNKWVVDYARILEEADLLALDAQGNIVWEETRAFMIPQRISDIYINLEGKFPKGTVDSREYEKVQEEVIDALLDLRNPDGKRVVAYALKKKDAQLLGFYGSEVGDVIFVFNSFHGRASLPEGVQVQRARNGANHGPQIATTKTKFSSDLASIIIAGPEIRKGYIHDGENDGLWRITDIAPTIAHILGFAPPSSSRGSVMQDIFE